MKRSLLYWLPPFLYCALVFLASAQPSVQVTHDKMAHFAAYSLMAFLFARAWASRGSAPWSVWLFAFLISTFYGVSDEIHQRFVPGRNSSLDDVLADATGALIGGLAYVVLAYLPKLRSPNR